MNAYKETILSIEGIFPVEIFIRDNLEKSLNASQHWHDCIEVLYIVEGSANQQINEHFFKVKAKDVVIVNYGVIHSTHCDLDESCKILVLKFMPQLISESFSFIDSKYLHLFLSQGESMQHHIEDVVSKDGFLHKLFFDVLKEYDHKDEAYEMMIKGYIIQILGTLIRNGNFGQQITMVQEDFLEVKPVIGYIEKNYMNNLTMAEVAQEFGMSYYHFSRFFKKAVGRNYKEYLDYVRVVEADKLLLKSQMSISAIAYEVGYSNVTSFNRVYKRIKGIAPSSIR
jgi:AraC family transcriptional activator of pobA